MNLPTTDLPQMSQVVMKETEERQKRGRKEKGTLHFVHFCPKGYVLFDVAGSPEHFGTFFFIEIGKKMRQSRPKKQFRQVENWGSWK